LIFQKTGRLPGEIYNLSPGEKRFIYTSMIVQLEEDEANYQEQIKQMNRNKK
jgi:hypothetical protein